MRSTAHPEAVVAAGVAARITGFGVMNSVTRAVSDPPITHRESTARVSVAATESVEALDLDVTEAIVWNAAYSDDGKGRDRGKVRISDPIAASFEQSNAEVAHIGQRLKKRGWNSESDVRSHSTVLVKNQAVASPQEKASTGGCNIVLYGERPDRTDGDAL